MDLTCSDCHYIFSDQEMLGLHKESCQDLQQNPPDKKKFFCPICDRQFRLLKNLKTHSQTIKHLDLLEWHHKQNQETLHTTNSNVKEITVTDSSLIERKSKGNSNLSDLEAALSLEDQKEEQPFSLSEELNSNYIDNLIDQTASGTDDSFLSQLMNSREDELNTVPNTNQPGNDFLAQLMVSRDQLEIKLNQPSEPEFNFEPEPRNDFNVQNGNNFLDNLISSRETQLDQIQNEIQSFQTEQQNQSQDGFLDQLMQSREQELRTYQRPADNFDLGTTIELEQPDTDNDLMSEIQQTRRELDADFNHHQAELEAKIEESDNPILNALSKIRESDILREQKRNAQPIIYGEPQQQQKIPEYPLQYHQHPVWLQMSRVIKEKDAPRRIVAVMLGSPLSYYPIIYTFVRFSDKLKGKREKELRFKLIASILEVQKHLIRMLQAGQNSWGQKPIKQVLLVMSQWKVADYYRELKKDK